MANEYPEAYHEPSDSQQYQDFLSLPTQNYPPEFYDQNFSNLVTDASSELVRHELERELPGTGISLNPLLTVYSKILYYINVTTDKFKHLNDR